MIFKIVTLRMNGLNELLDWVIRCFGPIILNGKTTRVLELSGGRPTGSLERVRPAFTAWTRLRRMQRLPKELPIRQCEQIEARVCNLRWQRLVDG